MKHYFKAAHTPECDQMTVTGVCLHGDAKFWWKTGLEEDVAAVLAHHSLEDYEE